jgi:hypothetical protein
MELTEAWTRLGIDPTGDTDAVRAAYLAQLHRHHPDHSAAPDANAVTATLTDAYQRIQGHLQAADPSDPVDPVDLVDPAQTTATGPMEVIPIALVADDTIAVALPPGETYALLVEAAHQMGEVVHIEPSSGMLQVIVEFLDAPTCQLLLTMQGRATGVTEVFCTVESLEQEPAPPAAAVARVLLDEVIEAGRRPSNR